MGKTRPYHQRAIQEKTQRTTGTSSCTFSSFAWGQKHIQNQIAPTWIPPRILRWRSNYYGNCHRYRQTRPQWNLRYSFITIAWQILSYNAGIKPYSEVRCDAIAVIYQLSTAVHCEILQGWSNPVPSLLLLPICLDYFLDSRPDPDHVENIGMIINHTFQISPVNLKQPTLCSAEIWERQRVNFP